MVRMDILALFWILEENMCSLLKVHDLALGFY